ncbi:MAG: MarR family transcriptional regulator [Sphingobacteriales bacterium]|nr:MarR family transcriptional regulator [Sphingobacteriales bacterium]
MKTESVWQHAVFQSDTQKAYFNVLFTAFQLKARVYKAIKGFGITHEQYYVLRILQAAQPYPLRLNAITARMLESNSNTTRIMDKLLAKKLVLKEHAEQDRRELQISITEKGSGLVAHIEELVFGDAQTWTALNETEAHLLNQILDKMRNVKG